MPFNMSELWSAAPQIINARYYMKGIQHDGVRASCRQMKIYLDSPHGHVVEASCYQFSGDGHKSCLKITYELLDPGETTGTEADQARIPIYTCNCCMHLRRYLSKYPAKYAKLVPFGPLRRPFSIPTPAEICWGTWYVRNLWPCVPLALLLLSKVARFLGGKNTQREIRICFLLIPRWQIKTSSLHDRLLG